MTAASGMAVEDGRERLAAQGGFDHPRELVDEHGLGVGRPVVGGHSAGGTLELWASGRRRISRAIELVDASGDVVGVPGARAVGTEGIDPR